MFKQLFEFVRQALFLQRDLHDLKDQVAQLEREHRETTEAMRKIAFELARVAERERHEREELLLRMENALLKVERLPPSSKESKRQK